MYMYMCMYVYIYIYIYTYVYTLSVHTKSYDANIMQGTLWVWGSHPSRISKGPPEYCQDGTVTHLNYNRLL